MEKIELIKERIKKLFKHSESAKEIGSLEEAQTFLDKVNELLIEYNLKLQDIKLDGEDKFAKWTYHEGVSYRNTNCGERWLFELMTVLTSHNFCNYTYSKHLKKLNVYGRMENVDVVVWLYNFLSIRLYNLGQIQFRNRTEVEKMIYGAARYNFIKDFLFGAVKGFDDQLIENKAKHQQQNNVTALMVINKAALMEYITEKIPNLGKAKKIKAVRTGPSYYSGYEAGKNLNLNKPLEKTKEIKVLQNK